MKYERKCSNCGRVDRYYAKGLCRTCYDRMRRHGTFELQYRRGVGSRPELWSDKTKRILELYRGGMRQVDIVKEIGLTKQEVSLVIKKYTKPSNYDRLVSKSPEELADWLAEVLFHCSNTICDERCPMYECCCGQPSDNIEDWLKQEAE